MPWSSWNGKEYTKAIIGKLKPQTALDVGCGAGTYRDILDVPHMDAIEAWEPYVDRYGLESAYDNLFICTVARYRWNDFYDLVIFGDVLEHMTKTQAQYVVGKALEVAKYVLLSLPIVCYPQGAVEGNPFEAHVKDDWSHEEVCETWGSQIAASNCHGNIGVYLLSVLRKDDIREAHMEVTKDNPTFAAMAAPDFEAM